MNTPKPTLLPVAILLLAAPVISSAQMLAVDWTGQIDSYTSTLSPVGPQFPPAPLSDTKVSGEFDINLTQLPTPAVSPGLVDFYKFDVTGIGYMTSSVQWQGGTFTPVKPGGFKTDDITLTPGQCKISDSVDYITQPGIFQTVSGVSLDLNFPSGLGSSDVSGSGNFFYQSFFSSFSADFTVNDVSVKVMPTAAPEIDPGTATTAVTFLAAALAVIRGRRRVV
jgi:hypothetical protein